MTSQKDRRTVSHKVANRWYLLLLKPPACIISA